jgi:hypothetical protein
VKFKEDHQDLILAREREMKLMKNMQFAEV